MSKQISQEDKQSILDLLLPENGTTFAQQLALYKKEFQRSLSKPQEWGWGKMNIHYNCNLDLDLDIQQNIAASNNMKHDSQPRKENMITVNC